MGHALILAGQGYGVVGAAVAAWFLLWRLNADPMATGAYAFRPLLVPGLVLLWPLVLWRLLTAKAPARTHSAAHHRIWIALAVALPLAVFASLALRQNGPAEAPPLRLAAP
jgi:hypothetical protein